jgi:hypothetical protein
MAISRGGKSKNGVKAARKLEPGISTMNPLAARGYLQ